ncbi:substrate-binding domain-containing protein [Rubrobacter marinus]|uniref:Substrate-binding domain-containing protein n=1 Tax=Rubrobacter marinus TaxID=2653852 RepID=A0A6G8PUS7_9ACTN|nr:substrate-binding domain-containing protein [Rubrobacter marinus]QIN77625.1 substrate-binding domain-containing protein [Rubrobacter marinus]
MDVKGGPSGAQGRRATLREVAAELGVSPATVSNAYNRPDQLSAGLRERVFEAAERLGYAGPDPLARGLRRRRAGAIGVLYEDRLSHAFADPAEVLFLRGFSVATEEAGLGLLLLSGAPGAERDPEMIRGAVVDGFVVYSMAEDDPLVGAALGRRVPAVTVDQPEIEGLPFVGIDDRSAAREAAEHLVGLGHRRFGVVSFALAPDVRSGLADRSRQGAATYGVTSSRLRGYAEALAEGGISWDDVPVYECPMSLPEVGEDATEALLAREPRPTAILALSDQLAFGVVEAAEGMGLSVPGDLSVVGFDDVPEAARATPPLTTVRQPHEEKGLRAGRALVARLREEEVSSPSLLPTRLVVRGSTAAPRSRA